MEFVDYDETSGVDYDKATRSALNELKQRYGKVELKQVKPSEFCVRIRTTITGVDTPMATIGLSVLDAAERLLRVMNPPS